ncbi:MAG TPA: signal peptidase I [Egibacteraceae bacterium]|nr:signal peptidase I [Egibacteraceae bacterium]
MSDIRQAQAAEESAPMQTGGAARTDGVLLTALRGLALVYVTLLVLTGVAILGVGALLGWRPYLVTSGSMAPAMRPGDVIVVEPAVPGKPYDVPTIITFRDPARGLVTHRVVAAEQAPNGEVRYTTKGDANPDAESGTVGQSELVGSVRYVVRDVGMPLHWAQHGRWGPFGAWAAGTLLAISLAVGLLRPRAAKESPS